MQQLQKQDSALSTADNLKAAVAAATVRPQIKGDTLESNIEHPRLPPNAGLEDMLKRLRGLQVAPDRTITNNGQKITG